MQTKIRQDESRVVSSQKKIVKLIDAVNAVKLGERVNLSPLLNDEKKAAEAAPQATPAPTAPAPTRSPADSVHPGRFACDGQRTVDGATASTAHMLLEMHPDNTVSGTTQVCTHLHAELARGNERGAP
jgi:hypothetical protein